MKTLKQNSSLYYKSLVFQIAVDVLQNHFKMSFKTPLMNRFFLSIVMLLAIGSNPVKGAGIEDSVAIYSPNREISVIFSTHKIKPDSGVLTYQVFYRNLIFLKPSRLGFGISGQPVLNSSFKIVSSKNTQHTAVWKPLYGEKKQYPDNYNEVELEVIEQLPPGRSFKIICRLYNEGIAFRYRFPHMAGQPWLSIDNEETEFALGEQDEVWEEHGHEGLYRRTFARFVKPNCELPLTVKTSNGIYGVIAEAGNEQYPRAYLRAKDTARSGTLAITLRGQATGKWPFETAWRTITLSDRAGGLLEQNYLILNLNKACKLKGNLDWIQPGKAIRDPSMSTISSKKYIDYAANHGLNYVIIDWGWYGPPNGEASDPTEVNVVNPVTGKPIPGHPGLNIPEVVAYGKTKGIGIWLYVNRQGLERYSEKAFAAYQKWGIKGIKPGFIHTGSQEWQEWIEGIVQKAAARHLMVDVHDAFRPTGYSRTYPNWMTQEGVRGNEHLPNADHNTMLPFTRFTIGAADYTPGYCRQSLQNTWAHRLALPIIYYSPVQFLFWGEQLNDCHERPELALWKTMPTTWDDTKVLSGDIGEYIVIARRKGNRWFIGGITNHQARVFKVGMSFLTDGKTYKATIYQDDTRMQSVQISTEVHNNKKQYTIPVSASGGFAMEIVEK